MVEDEWRLTWEENWMYGAALERRRFVAPSAAWDHEHCVLCQSKFMEAPHDAVHDGLVMTQLGSQSDERWICETCFADFAPRFGWTASGPKEAP